jgi:hypothetical protein
VLQQLRLLALCSDIAGRRLAEAVAVSSRGRLFL